MYSIDDWIVLNTLKGLIKLLKLIKVIEVSRGLLLKNERI